MADQLPEEKKSGDLTAGLSSGQQEQAIAAKKNKAVLPLLDVFAADVVRRIEDGTLAKEVAQMKVPQLITNLTKIIAAISKSSTVVVVPPAPGDQKDPTFLRAHSAAGMSEHEREKRRREVIDAEVVKKEGSS